MYMLHVYGKEMRRDQEKVPLFLIWQPEKLFRKVKGLAANLGILEGISL